MRTEIVPKKTQYKIRKKSQKKFELILRKNNHDMNQFKWFSLILAILAIFRENYST